MKQGSEEWKQLKSNLAKVANCQIPNDILIKTTTSDLLQICLKYPLLTDIFAFNNICDGFKKFENDFNGFRELLSRTNAVMEILECYKTKKPEALPNKGTIIEKGNYVISFSILELFLSHNLLIDKLDKRIVLSLLVSVKDDKKKLPCWYQTVGLQTNYLAIVKILQSTKDKSQLSFNTSG